MTASTLPANPAIPAMSRGQALAIGCLIALLVGLISGWLRYWLGFFVLIQGTLCGLFISWLFAKFMFSRSGPLPHPGFRSGLLWAFATVLFFFLGQLLGLGLAQPWFEPVAWLGRVLNGETGEFLFGIAATAGIHRGFAMNVSGGFWMVFLMIDTAILFFFLLAMPWSLLQTKTPRERSLA